jgi:hypothetical protein
VMGIKGSIVYANTFQVPTATSSYRLQNLSRVTAYAMKRAPRS